MPGGDGAHVHPRDPHLREASWLHSGRPAGAENITASRPPILRWPVPIEAPGIEVEANLGAFADHVDSQDAILVMEYPDRIVLAVADGVTPTSVTPMVDGGDGAQFAARTVLDHVRRAPPEADLGRVLHDANRLLVSRFGTGPGSGLRPRDRPQAAVVVARIVLSHGHAIERVDVARAADCDVWTRRGRRWSLATPTPMLTPGPREALERWDAAHPDATSDERIEEEIRLLDDRSRWNLTALGRFERPRIESLVIPVGFDEVMLVTDGADIARLGVSPPPPDARRWLVELRELERRHRPHNQPHSDVAMLRLEVGGGRAP